MLNVTRRCLGSSVWPAVALLFLLPNLAQAQLFPDRTIRRVRPPCATETPFNAQVRRDYFGYYPTCWSRFPAGWQCPCPNPELPNLEASIRGPQGEFGSKKLIDDRVPPAGMGDDNPDDAGRGPDPTREIPLPNNGRSAFDIPPDAKAPATGTDPFTSPNPPNPAPAPNLKPTNPAGRPSAGVLDMPTLPETAPATTYESPLTPGSMEITPDATLTSASGANVRPNLGPLPSAPVSIPNDLTSPGQTSLGVPAPAMTSAPAQAPRRQSLLSRLFGPRGTSNR